MGHILFSFPCPPLFPPPFFLILANLTHYIGCLAPYREPLKAFDLEKAAGSKQYARRPSLAEVGQVICSNTLCYSTMKFGG